MESDRSGGFTESGVFPVVRYPGVPALDEERFLADAVVIGEQLRAILFSDGPDRERALPRG